MFTPVRLPNSAPLTDEFTNAEGLSNCVRPSEFPTVPIFNDKDCGCRPDVAGFQGTVTLIMPVAGVAGLLALASVPSELNVIVPVAIGLVPVTFVLAP